MVTLEILKEKSAIIQEIEKLRQIILSSSMPNSWTFAVDEKMNEISTMVNEGYKIKEESVKNVGNV